jgi:RimK family alpha-L-glutamate ligase
MIMIILERVVSMTGWLVVNGFLHSYKFNEIHTWLMNAAEKLNIQMYLKTNAELLVDLPKKRLNHTEREVDFILFWDKDVKLAKRLEQLGYPVFNSANAIGVCDDKSLTHLTLMGEGIPMPRTILAPMTFANIGYTDLSFLKEVANSLGFPMVVKECFGSFGQQVYMVHNEQELVSKVDELGAKPMLFQEYISNSFARDIRIQVVGGKVIASMYRYSDQGDFRANISNGGKMKAYEPTKEQCELAIRCCEIIGLDFAGVDILFDQGENPIVCEVNSNAHFKNIYDCTGVNAADVIMEYIAVTMNNR